jgi:ribokinase
MSRVIVCGSVNLDEVVRVSQLPRPGETIAGGEYSRFQGGKSANQAVAAARLGAKTEFIGAVGDDVLGTEARRSLTAEGIDASALLVVKRAHTGLAFVIVDHIGENYIAIAAGANAQLSPEHVNSALERTQLTSNDVLLVANEVPSGTTTQALQQAAYAEARSILNPAPAYGVTIEMLGLATILTPNEQELNELVPGEFSPETRALRLLECSGRAEAVIVTQGSRGALLATAGGVEVLKAPQVPVVDTVGAGDTFNGALAAGLSVSIDLSKAARRAVVAASMSVSTQGAREGMPFAQEVDAFWPVGLRSG